MARISDLAAQYGDSEPLYPDGFAPVVTPAPRSSTHSYPTETPVIALAHTVGLRPIERNRDMYRFMEMLERIACKWIAESNMAPPPR
ncbi:hypothetical protein AMAG_14812 [Allomyces macrogynus ATCC 38327]|uniref:Uncharacterized protein n=1 Tax=Allomyces macrogynus (strain ATCC 38327) TaxID=578462 RepID=A0A0L0T616_ALLM3|nr:hypothetical protein AMAG_14812 [Allomyces macrogynus ATCC 38327]|eukprot:KNE69974.1 hypothetical protein AMAG_14812 [Allomyces macrogynus ATCC 38327]